ncbi:MAG: oxygen-independent coproporphyrinogen III oxidase [Myxococcota bacterium]
MVALSSELVSRYDRPGPRYTSYPPVPRWSTEPSDRAWHDLVEQLGRPTALYVHVPFCKERCVYCGCNMVVSRRQAAGDRFLDALDRQSAEVPPLRLQWIHLGGGTPTWLDPRQIRRLFSIVGRVGSRRSDCEVSVEVDPMVTTDERLEALLEQGTRRLSIGVQSLDPTVLDAVDRPQSPEHIEQLVVLARDGGIDSLNVDLMTGLPHQTPDTLGKTIASVLRWRPERLSVFGYAHVPWLKRHQRAIDTDALPGSEERAELRLLAHQRLVAAGYVAIGFDHYAKPDDALARSLRDDTLGRNFMGYTPYRGLPVIALGPSAISEVDGSFVQLEPHLGRWYEAVEQGRMPVVRAYRGSANDHRNAWIIESILCRGGVAASEIRDRFGRLPDTWGASLDRLAPLVEDGLVRLTADQVLVTEAGRFFLRVVAMAFDPTLAAEPSAGRYSRTV